MPSWPGPFSNSCCYFFWTLCSARPLPGLWPTCLSPGPPLGTRDRPGAGRPSRERPLRGTPASSTLAAGAPLFLCCRRYPLSAQAPQPPECCLGQAGDGWARWASQAQGQGWSREWGEDRAGVYVGGRQARAERSEVMGPILCSAGGKGCSCPAGGEGPGAGMWPASACGPSWGSPEPTLWTCWPCE